MTRSAADLGPGGLMQRIEARLDASVHPAISEYAARLAGNAGACAVLFYGSNLRTGSLEGVLDYYVLYPGPQQDRIWPRVSYHEWEREGETLRAKAATMALETFASAAAGELADTTIWARFVQPSALVWVRSNVERQQVVEAIASASKTAARLGVALGPASGRAEKYWRALFRATYAAEFRVEKSGREDSILSVNAEHFSGLLPLALEAADIPFTRDGDVITPRMAEAERRRIRRWWTRRRRLGKPLNIVRLVKASATFDGAARYAAWKVERHTGIPVEISPFAEKHPVLAAPGVLFKLWREKRRRGG